MRKRSHAIRRRSGPAVSGTRIAELGMRSSAGQLSRISASCSCLPVRSAMGARRVASAASSSRNGSETATDSRMQRMAFIVCRPLNSQRKSRLAVCPTGSSPAAQRSQERPSEAALRT